MAELMRRQYLVTEENISKLEDISNAEGVSATEIVRRAIDAYHPNDADDLAAPELMELVSKRLKEAIADTQKTRRRLNKTLNKLETHP
jgi:hypothetical protein